MLLALAQSGTLDKVLGAGSERTSKAFEGSPLMDPAFTYEGSLLRIPTLAGADEGQVLRRAIPEASGSLSAIKEGFSRCDLISFLSPA